MFKKIKAHLSDNSGSAYLEKIILIGIAFIVGAAILGALWTVIRGDDFKDGMGGMIGNMFNW